MSERPLSSRGFTRRRFLSRGAAGLGGAAFGAFAAPAFLTSRAVAGEDAVRMAFIGVGGRGTTHLRTLLEHQDAEVTWVCDLREERMSRAAGLVREATGREPSKSADYQKVLAAPDVDAVLIAVPCDVHARLYLDTIAAGKDLYAEKPLCITVEECDAVVEAAKGSESIVQVGLQRRYDPRIQEGMKRIRRGDLGELLEVRSGYLAHFGPIRDWRSKRARSGDWMVEQAVHFFDLMNWALGGLARTAYGRGRQDVFTAEEPDRDVTDYYTSILEYPEDVVVDWLHSWICPAKGPFHDNYMQVLGREGGIDVEKGTVEFMDRDRPGETIEAPEVDATQAAQEAFLDCVRRREEPVSGVENGRDAVLIGLLVRKAVYEHRRVAMEEIVEEG